MPHYRIVVLTLQIIFEAEDVLISKVPKLTIRMSFSLFIKAKGLYSSSGEKCGVITKRYKRNTTNRKIPWRASCPSLRLCDVREKKKKKNRKTAVFKRSHTLSPSSRVKCITGPGNFFSNEPAILFVCFASILTRTAEETEWKGTFSVFYER